MSATGIRSRTRPPRGKAVPARRVLAALLLAQAAPAPAAKLPIPAAAFASLGQASHAVAGHTLRIRQQSETAILNWKSFDLGRKQAVRFLQPSSSAVALNRIQQADPSQILGRVSANGQIYLINQNGFVFGRNSSVNANTLIASTLDIGDRVLERGLSKAYDQDGLPALQGDGDPYRRDAAGIPLRGAAGQPLKRSIVVEPGASLAADAGGRILLAAPAVDNRGRLSAPDGQVILAAAGDKVYLQEAGGDPGLRGLWVEVETGGEAANHGKILTPHGNTTLIGFAVNQAGRITATTSVRANGSVRLLAREGMSPVSDGERLRLTPARTTRPQESDDGLGSRARLVVGAHSRTLADPDVNDPATAVDGQTQEKSRIGLMGQTIEVQSGAVLRARGGEILAHATEHPDRPGQAGADNASRIYVDAGARLDVSGVKGVGLPMSRNVVKVELRKNELRDSPKQRDGVLYGKTVRVDIRKGTPLADILGALERIERTVAERSSAGGSIALSSEGDTLIRPRSLLDFSGGSLDYRAGQVRTTKLISDRKLIDIGVADPNLRYDGTLDRIERRYPCWNLGKHWNLGGLFGHYEQGYREGKPAGELRIESPRLALDGELRGGAMRGLYQREPGTQAAAGRLSIDLARAPDSTQAVQFRAAVGTAAAGPDAPFPDDPGPPGQPAPLILPADLYRRSGIGTLAVSTQGRVNIGAGQRIDLHGDGGLALDGGEIHLDGTIAGPGAAVTLTTHTTSATLGRLSGLVELGPQAAIDVAGRWSNDQPNRLAPLDTSPVFIDGGAVRLVAEGDVRLAAGSRIDASGAAWRNSRSGKLIPGKAGTIHLEAARPGGSGVFLEGAELDGYAVAGGESGTLELVSSALEIGTGAPGGGTPEPLVLDPQFFRRGGFRRYQLTANRDGFEVAAGTVLELGVPNRVLTGNGGATRASGDDIRRFSRVEWLPAYLRQAPELRLRLAQTADRSHATEPSLHIAAGATIRTDAGGSIGLDSDGGIRVEGTLAAPGGDIALRITPPQGFESGYLANQGIALGGTARLDAAGTALYQPDALGRSGGRVLPGGRVALLADRGFVRMERGALVDVSGTAAVLDLPYRRRFDAALYRPRTVPSDGGAIELRAAEGMSLAADLIARPGAGRGAGGGTLAVELNRQTRQEPDQLQTGQLPFPTGPSVLRLDGAGGDTGGFADLTAAVVRDGGFSTLRLVSPDRIEFGGDVSLRTERSIVLDAPQLSSPSGNSIVLAAAHVALGSNQTRPDAGRPEAGAGRLEVRANLIELIGTARLLGFGQADLASSGDIRAIGIQTNLLQPDLLGEFAVAGDLDLRAGQIYPATLSDFRISAGNAGRGVLRVLPGGTPADLLAAAGRLRLEAPVIVQAGTLKAPFGAIELHATDTLKLAAGSLISNSGKGLLVPFGRSQGGLDWIYPLGQFNRVYAATPDDHSLPPPEKTLRFEAAAVEFAAGAVVDTSGGGDLLATEFIPGPGGSTDILAPQTGSFAILPDFHAEYAPHDPLETPGSGLRVGDSLHLAGGGGLPADDYVLLPARYALLPGAWLVTPEPGLADFLPGTPATNGFGDAVLAGYRKTADTGIRDARWSAFAVEPRGVVKTRAEYAEIRADEFFGKSSGDTGSQPWLPRDAGNLAISAGTELSLAGRIEASAARGGRGGRLDIAAERLAVLASAEAVRPLAGAVNLTAGEIDRLGVPSLVLGGIRSRGTGTTELAVRSSQLAIGQGARLSGTEFIFVAKDGLEVGAGARIEAGGAASGQDQTAESIHIDGDSAVLRLATGTQAKLERSGVEARTGSLRVGAGAVLSAAGSAILDATADSELLGGIVVQGGALALGASRISLGTVPEGTAGLVLGPALLQGLNVDELVLHSGSDLSLSGPIDLDLKRLTLRTGGILGYGDGPARLRADSLLLENPTGALPASNADGHGSLELAAGRIVLGQGSYTLQGFDRVDLNATTELLGSGAGRLVCKSDLGLSVPVWTSASGADTRIDAGGYRLAFASDDTATATTEALGGQVTATANRIDLAGTLRLPSGTVALHALAGNLTLADGALIDVAGRELDFHGEKIATDGGDITLGSATGAVALAPGASLDLRGARGGSLNIAMPQAAFAYSGKIQAQGTISGGFQLDAGALANGGDLGPLGTALAASGFGEEIGLRTRAGDLVLNAADTLTARDLSLAADTGSVRLAGSLVATGTDAELRVGAGDELRLAASARLAARGSADGAGQVVLEALGAAPTARIVLEPGAVLDVAASDGSDGGGTVQLRAARIGAEVAIDGSLQGMVRGAKNGDAAVTVEAVRRHAQAEPITADDVAAWKSDLDAFMAQADGIEQRLGIPGGLRPGLEVDSGGDLRFAEDFELPVQDEDGQPLLDADGFEILSPRWNLFDWRWAGRPGVLSLRAAGDLLLNRSISDGFIPYAKKSGIDLSGLLGPGATMAVADRLQTGESWSYRFTAGGDVAVDSEVAIRTGTGDIRIEAGRDFLLADAGSSVYTAGRAPSDRRYGSFKNAWVAYEFYAEYPVDGGAIDIRAGRDLRGAASGQLFEDWFARTGNWQPGSDHAGQTPTAWGLSLGRTDPAASGAWLDANLFRRNLGALGGGDLRIRAGRDVVDVSALLPTTGKQVGEPAQPDSPDHLDFTGNEVEVSTGGNLLVQAGGDIRGGLFEVDRGLGRLRAGGSIAAAPDGTAAPVLALGDGRFDLMAGRGIVLDAAFDPGVLPSGRNAGLFFTYSGTSGLSLTALAGDVVLRNDAEGFIDRLNALRGQGGPLDFVGSGARALAVYPGSLEAVAVQGDIRIENSLVTYPAPQGRFSLLAGGNLTSGAHDRQITVLQSDADAALLPSAEFPGPQNFEDAARRLDAFGAAAFTHAARPVHGGDATPARIVAAGGGLLPRDPLLISLAQPARVYAKTDLRDASLWLQHPDDAVSTIEVGGVLAFSTPRDGQGNLLNVIRSIQVSGPGELWIDAGGDVDLGASDGVYTLGNSFNPALAESGASISILAGMKTPADFRGFAATLAPAELAEYQALPEARRRGFLLGAFFADLREAATAAARSGRKADFEPGFRAIRALFPGQGEADRYDGDVKLFFSKIHTLDGGDINLLVPGGLVNAGLSVAFSGQKDAADLGIVAEREGAVNAFADGDFQVNQSRVFALDGGDITVWSSRGDIDAGRGAKSALAVPPPRIVFDEQGNLRVEFPPVVSGSGIRTATGTPGRPAGDVYLAAPRGVVDASEAGIGGNNIILAATAIIGASNIDVGGQSLGLPAAPAVAPPLPAGAGNALAGATQAVESTAATPEDREAQTRRERAMRSLAFNALRVEVIGFGDCSLADVREGKAGCGGR